MPLCGARSCALTESGPLQQLAPILSRSAHSCTKCGCGCDELCWCTAPSARWAPSWVCSSAWGVFELGQFQCKVPDFGHPLPALLVCGVCCLFLFFFFCCCCFVVCCFWWLLF